MKLKKCFKNYWLIACAAMGTLPALAQTNFRSVSFDEAITAAKSEKKLVFIDFYTDWCGPCKMMARDVFPQKAVGDYMNNRFVCIKLNAEKEGKALAEQFKIKAYPTFIVTDTEKKIVMTKVGGASADNFLAEIERKINPDSSPKRLKERYESGERSAALISAYAAYKTSEDKTGFGPSAQEAQKIVKDYFNQLDSSARLAHENLFIYTNYTKELNDDMARFMIENRNNFPADDRAQINDLVKELYKKQVYNYLMKYIPYDATAYQQVKKEINELGLNSKGEYNGVFQLIECYAKGNLENFLKLCEKVYPKLDEEQQSCLIANMGGLIDTPDKALRKKASTFIRGLLPNMTINQLGMVMYPLSILEKQ